MPRKQPFFFSFADTLLAELGGVPLDALHRDVDAICRCYSAVQAIAERLGVPTPRPRIGGFSYTHVSTLGARVVFADGSEPNVLPILMKPEDIDAMQEPDDYLSSGVAPQRIQVMEGLRKRHPNADSSLDLAEGPLTTAGLLMGPQFFTLPYEDPARTHRLLRFVVESSLNYNRAVNGLTGKMPGEGPVGICDDFAGMYPPKLFDEFVLPYWERMYAEQHATERNLHSELLRVEHLPFLEHLGIAVFDPSADQYVSPPLLRKYCPVPFTARILTWQVRDLTVGQLCRLYRDYAACEPVRISFYMAFVSEEEKISALLETAREMA